MKPQLQYMQARASAAERQRDIAQAQLESSRSANQKLRAMLSPYLDQHGLHLVVTRDEASLIVAALYRDVADLREGHDHLEASDGRTSLIKKILAVLRPQAPKEREECHEHTYAIAHKIFG